MNLSHIYYLYEIGGKKNQEDYIWPSPGMAAASDKIFIVCDGVGGSENGEIASRIIAEHVGKSLLQTAPENISTNTVNNLLLEAKQKLAAYAAAGGLNNDMATTFSLLVLFPNKALIAWCGDSRVYHLRNGKILYKTSDHSLVNTLVKNGEITEAEALTHPQKHIILKAINGDDAPAEAEGHWINGVESGDYFLLCTDGLLENISDTDIETLINPDNTNIVASIQERCAGKTRDNYSFYLLQTGLQQQELPQKIAKKSPALWLPILAALLLAGAFYLFDKKEPATAIVPAIKADSTGIEPPGSSIAVDTAIRIQKDSLPYVELENAREQEEKKITPAPLPETKNGKDVQLPKTSSGKGKDTFQLDLSTLPNEKKSAVKKDTGSKRGKPLN